jgi:diguanylate cyclase (GGDEF)-like protein
MEKLILSLGRVTVVLFSTFFFTLLSLIISLILLIAFGIHSNFIVPIIYSLILTPIATWPLITYIEKVALLQERIKGLEISDTLTGLLSHQSFVNHCRTYINIATREYRVFSLLSIDIDMIKGINKLFGDGAGDTIIKDFSTLIKEAQRKSDIIGRLGGSEFAILLPNTSLENGISVAEKLRVKVERSLVKYNEENLHYTVSIGVAVSTNAATTIESIMSQANMAMFGAKEIGQNAVISYVPPII